MVLFISFMSCSSDSDESEDDFEQGNATQLMHEWNLETWEYTMVSSYEGVSLTTMGEAQDINATLKFNSDNTFNFQGSYTIVMSIEGMEAETPVNGAASSGNYSIDGTMLTLSNTLGEMEGQQVNTSGGGEMEIVELSDSRLVLQGEKEIVTEAAGLTSTIKSTEYYEFSR